MVDVLICFKGVMNNNSVFTQLDDNIFYSCCMLHVWQLYVASLKKFCKNIRVLPSISGVVVTQFSQVSHAETMLLMLLV